MVTWLHKAYKLLKTSEFQDWIEELTLKEKAQVLDRLKKIELDGYFGDHKRLNDFIWELKWVNGRRLYYAYVAQVDILLLLGGTKNGQNKDIVKAKNILKKYTNDSGA